MADEQQRERFREALDEKERAEAEEASMRAHEEQLDERDRPQDTKSVRAKNSGHKKVTADKWNQ